MTTLVGGGTFPIGGVLPFAGPVANIPDGFLLCDGGLLNRNDFAQLFDVIGTNWGTDSGVDFRLPTTQGLLLRGVAYGSGNDPDRNTRTATQTGGQTGDEVGSFQNWRIQSHNHVMIHAAFQAGISYLNSGPFNGHSNTSGNAIFNSGIGNRMSLSTRESGVLTLATANGNAVSNNTTRGGRTRSSNTGGSQTVGQNVNMNFIIKFN